MDRGGSGGRARQWGVARGGDGRPCERGKKASVLEVIKPQQKPTAAFRSSPDTILQLMVIGWKDFLGDSAGLAA